jgi:hypothetical protein
MNAGKTTPETLLLNSLLDREAYAFRSDYAIFLAPL